MIKRQVLVSECIFKLACVWENCSIQPSPIPVIPLPPPRISTIENKCKCTLNE